MPDPLHYAKAPITEATIDLRVTLPDGVKIEQLAELQQALQESFPESQKIYVSELSFQFGDEPQAENQQQHTGFRLISEDKKQIVQIRTDGFAFSILNPYDSWEPFCSQARSLWDLYRKAMKPTQIGRVAVRYINRLDILDEEVELKDFLRTFPELSPDLPQVLLGYFMQLVIPQNTINGVAVINQTIIPPAQPHTTSVLLDIEVFCEKELPTDEDAIWALFEQLRNSKNTIFQACLTQRAEALIS